MLIPAWAVFAAVNLGLMFVVPGGETIPFHLVWFSLALAYGLAPWRLRTMVFALAVVTVSTFFALEHHARAGYIGYEELAEVPLMAAIFLAMVWHVRRRQDALAVMEHLAGVDRDSAEAGQMFVRLVSHEMRTPLTVARGYTELIRSSGPDPQTAEDSGIVLDELAKLDRSTRRLATLVAPDSPADLEVVDLDQLLTHAARRWTPTAARHWHVESTAGDALLDAERFRTALDCLLENAVKFTADGDAIELRGRREAGHVVIQVTDTGEGIPTADLPHVFDTFHRGSNAVARDGTGLGLSIVRRIVEARGGTAEAASRPHRGATFTLRLPTEAQQPSGTPARGLVDGAGSGPRRTASGIG